MSTFIDSKKIAVPLSGPWFRLIDLPGSPPGVLEVWIDTYDDGAVVRIPAFSVALSKNRAAATAVASLLAILAKKVLGV